jgi:hypothetical protein
MLTNRQPTDRANVAVGLLVLIAGVVLLAAQAVRFELPADSWPYVIIVPGLAILLVGLVIGREPGTGLAIGGSIVTTVGLVLLYQNTTGRWDTWAYAWALVGPTAAGVGLLLSGLVQGDRDLLRNGLRVVLVGATLFAVGLVFFEGVIGLSGERPAILETAALPLILIGLGVVVVARGFLRGRGPAAS